MAASEVGGQGIPCVYCLLPNKKEDNIPTAVQQDKGERVGAPNRLTTIITDFELAVFKACDIVFPDVQHKGCRFHHNAAVWKNLGAHKLQSLFYQNPRFQELIYSLYSLCYVPSDRVNEYYHEVITKLVDDGKEKDEEWEDYQEEINAFACYYRTTWIKKRGGRGALFKPGTSTPLSLRGDLKPTTCWSHLIEPGIVCLATARMYLLSKSYLLNRMLRLGGLIYRMQSAWTWRQIQVKSRDQRTPDRG